MRPADVPTIVILHWNDMHSANLPYKPQADYFVGGYRQSAGYIDSLRNLYPQALVLNAGDDFQGSPVFESDQRSFADINFGIKFTRPLHDRQPRI
jgi:2',3'-cyclic-nucleotide 2'-phosphodiesterase (5'-nucleotidase family)